MSEENPHPRPVAYKIAYAQPRDSARDAACPAMEAFLADQARYLDDVWADLVEHGLPRYREVFLALARDTAAVEIAAGRQPAYYKPDDEGFRNPALSPSLPADLRRRWVEWAALHADLVRVNPRLELATMLRDLGYTYILSPWPMAMEDQLLAWVDRGERLPLPIDDRDDIIDDAFYERLRALRRATGGWIWQAGDGRLVFRRVPPG